jgi:hypothetical protein
MRLWKAMQWWLVVLASWTLVLPVHVCGADGSAAALPPSTAVHDVALQAGGRLVGRVVDATGQPAATRVVVVDQAGIERASTHSNERGEFSVAGLSAGVYLATTSNAAVACRCWAVRTAPPSAQSQLLLVDDPLVARGQRPIGDLLCCPPLLLTALVVAAIAIPIAVHNAQDDDDDAS